MARSITKIVLDGGPCGLKSTALAYLREKLPQMGVDVLVLQEVVTRLVLDAGISPESMSEFDFERIVFQVQRFEEHMLLEAARRSTSTRPLAMICDRGFMSIMPYFKRPDDFIYLIEKYHNQNIQQIRDERYDVILFLHSLAHDKPELYEKFWQSNPARRETTPEQARALDNASLAAWTGSEHVKIVGNYDDPGEKLRAVLRVVCASLKMPVPLEIERKYLVEGFPRRWPKGMPVQMVEIEQAYLASAEDGVERRVRKSATDGHPAFSRTYKRHVGSGVREEHTEIISGVEYLRGLAYRDTGFHIIKKERTYFPWQCQYFSLDRFLGPIAERVPFLLEIELTDRNALVTVPWFLEVTDEVTHDPRYSNRELARIDQ